MDRDDRLLDAGDVVGESADQLAEHLRVGVTRGVGDVHDGGAGRNDRLDHTVEVRGYRSAGVLGVELDVAHEIARMLDRLDGPLDGLVARDAQLVAQVRLAHPDAGVDARA